MNAKTAQKSSFPLPEIQSSQPIESDKKLQAAIDIDTDIQLKL
jgi:hypothetical protein